MLFLCYPKCSTCQKAKAFLDQAGVSYELRDIKLQKPSQEELRRWQAESGLPLKKFFNTSGLQYRALELAKRLPQMSEDEQFSLLASAGMLVKRPLLIGDGFVLAGFRQGAWEAKLKCRSWSPPVCGVAPAGRTGPPRQTPGCWR